MRLATGVVVVVLLAAACGGGDEARPALSGEPPATTTTAPPLDPAADTELQAELVAMFRLDQWERTGEGEPPDPTLAPAGDRARSERLREIIDEHGWPTIDLVGKDGATAAWVIAQHADFDVAWQREVVDLMTDAVAAGQADPTELAYLVDRVAVNSGEPQTYGTQVRCNGTEPAPATPILDEDRVDERRLAAGMQTLAEYYDEFGSLCAEEG